MFSIIYQLCSFELGCCQVRFDFDHVKTAFLQLIEITMIMQSLVSFYLCLFRRYDLSQYSKCNSLIFQTIVPAYNYIDCFNLMLIFYLKSA